MISDTEIKCKQKKTKINIYEFEIRQIFFGLMYSKILKCCERSSDDFFGFKTVNVKWGSV